MARSVTTRYPVQYHCGHCGASGLTKKEGKPTCDGNLTCPTCKFGYLVKGRWNGFRWV